MRPHSATKEKNARASFSEILKVSMNAADATNCLDPGCNRTTASEIGLLLTPRVVAFGISWTSDSPDSSHIKAVLRMLQPDVELHKVFQVLASS